MFYASLYFHIILVWFTFSKSQADTFQFIKSSDSKNNEILPAILQDRVTLNCETNSKAKSLKLFKVISNGLRQLNINGRRISQTDGVFSVLIRRARDEGQYICESTDATTNKTISKYFTVLILTQGELVDVRLYPQNVTIDHGKSIELSCFATNQTESLSWYRYDKQITTWLPNVKVIKTVLNQMLSSFLQFSSITKKDAGSYRCVATQIYQGKLVRKEAQVHVTVNGARFQWVNPEEVSQIAVAARGSFIIDCRLSDRNALVKFHKQNNDGSIEEIILDGTKYLLQSNQELLINDAVISDGLSYMCRNEDVAKERKIQVFINTGILSSRNPRPSIDYRELRVEHLGSGNLTCIAYGNTFVLSWFRLVNSSMIEVESSQVFRKRIITPRGIYETKAVLMIRNATKLDAGYYICRLATQPQSQSKLSIARAKLLVRAPKAPVIRKFYSARVNQSQPVSFYCNTRGSPPPTVAFFINNRKITDDTTMYKVVKNVLYIHKAQYPDDNGTILCIATNQLGSVNKTATLQVTVTPVLQKTDSIILSSLHNSTVIECRVQVAEPVARIIWERQPSPCYGSIKCNPIESLWQRKFNPVHFHISPPSDEATFLSVLTVSPSIKQDYFFRCKAINDVGSANHVVSYFYRKNQTKSLMVHPSYAVINEGKDLNLLCKGQPGLFKDITWTYKDMIINSTNIIVSKLKTKFDVRQSNLQIKNAMPGASGFYSCIGWLHKQGNSDRIQTGSEVLVKETFAPKINTSWSDVTVNESETVILSCDISSNPPAKIQWFRNGKAIYDVDRITSSDQCENTQNGYYHKSHGSQIFIDTLIICQAELKNNNATFTCEAKNELGKTNSSIKVTVQARPSVLKIVSNPIITEDDEFHQLCIASGHPMPIVWWQRGNQYGEFKDITIKEYGQSNLTFDKIVGDDFDTYRCVANNSMGEDYAVLYLKPSYSMSANGRERSKALLHKAVIIAMGVAAGILFILILILASILMRRRKMYGGLYLFSDPPSPDHFRKIDPNRALSEQVGLLPYAAEWEFSRSRVKLLNILGFGAFGEVHLAEAVGIRAHDPRYRMAAKQKPLFGRRKSRSDSTSSRSSHSYKHTATKVAVKKLKDTATTDDFKDLVCELKILIHIGEHANIVNLLGSCTKGKESEMMLLLEFAPHGNLLSFMKGRRDMFRPSWAKHTNDMENELTTLDLVLSAYQIAKGMEFLASRKCVHRDLAARNVLVGEGYIMKIADFGLARDIYQDERYVKVSSGLLPIKWMAIEAIRDRVCTHQSDVWSFGILLWELTTLGGSPYPGLPTRELLNFLCAGKRMDRPQYCPEELYALMACCWAEKQDERPPFFDVVGQLSSIVNKHCSPENYPHYMDPVTVTEDDYLRPIESPQALHMTDGYLPMSPAPPPYSPESFNNPQRFFSTSGGSYISDDAFARAENDRSNYINKDTVPDQNENNDTTNERKDSGYFNARQNHPFEADSRDEHEPLKS